MKLAPRLILTFYVIALASSAYAHHEKPQIPAKYFVTWMGIPPLSGPMLSSTEFTENFWKKAFVSKFSSFGCSQLIGF
jgi:hypothetical protein